MSTVMLLIRYGGDWISTDDNKLIYVGGSTESCYVEPNITLDALRQEIADSIGLNIAEFKISLACQYRRPDIPPLQIRSNKNVRNFIEFISRLFPDQEPVYVSVSARTPIPVSDPVQPSPIRVVSPVHLVLSPQNVAYENFYVEDNVVPPMHSSTGSNQHGDSVGPMSCTENRQYDLDLDYDYSAVFSSEIGHNETGDDPSNVRIHGVEVDTDNPRFANDVVNQFDEYDYTTCRQNEEENFMYEDRYIPESRPFTDYYHDIHHTDDGTATPLQRQTRPCLDFSQLPQLHEDIHPSYNPSDLDIGGVCDGQIFDNKMQLQDTLALHAIRHKYQYVTYKSTKNRWEVRCTYDSCKWRCRATKVGDSDCFVVKKIHAMHTCPRDQVYPNHRQATARLVGLLQKSKFTDVNRVHRPINIVQDILEEFGINLSYVKAWRAREFALTSLMGSAEESYAILPKYCEQLEQVNPGTMTEIVTDDDNHFKYFFLSVGAWWRAFRAHLRKVIAVDGTFMKGKYYGTLFVAVCLDGNNQIYPVAFGICDSENDESWTYFFTKLNDVIGDTEDLVFISDRHKSIEKAVSTVFPSAIHGVCCHHLRQNVKKKFKTDMISVCYWRAAKSYRVSDFNEHIGRLRSMSNDTYMYLQNVGFDKWARSHFPGRRYNIMTTNIAESMNKVLKFARRLPVTMCVEFIRATMQKWFRERLTIATAMDSHLSHWASVKVGNHVMKSGSFVVLPVNNFMFQVRDGRKDGLVNLEARTCSCRKWQLSQLPCSHVAAVCRHLGMSDCHQWCHDFFTRETLIRVYCEPIIPIPHEADWDSSEEVLCRLVLPPTRHSRPVGRPRVNRIPSIGEEVQQRKCGRCGQFGHNRQNCTNPMPLNSSSRAGSSSSTRCE